jgi:hypothetical protein
MTHETFGLAGISAATGHGRKQDALPEDRGLEKRLPDLMNEVCKGVSVGFRGGRKLRRLVCPAASASRGEVGRAAEHR